MKMPRSPVNLHYGPIVDQVFVMDSVLSYVSNLGGTQNNQHIISKSVNYLHDVPSRAFVAA